MKLIGISILFLLIVPVLFASEGSWLNAGGVKAGDYLLNSAREWVKVKSVQKVTLEEPVKVYNLGVSGFHTYFVGLKGILVHNKDSSLVGKFLQDPSKVTKIISIQSLNKKWFTASELEELFGAGHKIVNDGKEMVYINIKDLRPIQDLLDLDYNTIRQLRNAMNSKGFDISEAVPVMKVDGEFIVRDGHHRAVAWLSLNNEKIPVLIEELDEVPEYLRVEYNAFKHHDFESSGKYFETFSLDD